MHQSNINILVVQASNSESSKEALHGILGGRPVLALAFDNMEMTVSQPSVVQVKRRQRKEEMRVQPALAWAMAN